MLEGLAEGEEILILLILGGNGGSERYKIPITPWIAGAAGSQATHLGLLHKVLFPVLPKHPGLLPGIHFNSRHYTAF